MAGQTHGPRHHRPQPVRRLERRGHARALLAVELGLGLFAVDVDGVQPGPFAKVISFDQGRAVAEWHHWGAFNALLGLVGLHLLAIVFYAVVKRDNLVGPMLTGAKSPRGRCKAPMTASRRWRRHCPPRSRSAAA